jgi:ribosome-binding factor A
MTGNRIDRVSEAIRREISVILQEEIEDPQLRDICITNVEVTADIGLARVYYTVPGDRGRKEAVRKHLKSAGGFFRSKLAARVSMRSVPKISFIEDDTRKRSESIDKLFERIEKELHGPKGPEKEEKSEE